MCWLIAIPVVLLEMLFTAVGILIKEISGRLAILRVMLHRRYDYRRWLERDLADCDTILELGCGFNSPILQIGYGGKTVAVDIFQPYVDRHSYYGDYRHCFEADILTMDYSENKFDAVVMCDVLEHLPRQRVEKFCLFEKMEQCARKKVIILAPNGFVPNDELDGDSYQAHVSAWEPTDYLKHGYSVRGVTGLRLLFGKAMLPKYHPYSICAAVGMLTQPLVYGRPQWARKSYAVKEVSKT